MSEQARAPVDPLAGEAGGVPDDSGVQVVYRHALLVRVTHWINALSFLVLIPSGAMIAWANPEFYWGETGFLGAPALIRLPLTPFFDLNGYARETHFTAAWLLVLNGLVYLASGIASGHFRRRMLPSRDELRPSHLLHQVIEHARFRPARGGDSLRFNILQKLAYLVVLFLLLPLMLTTGLTMSPGVTAGAPWLFTIFGGRQSARTIHFLCANALVFFIILHVVQVVVGGFANEMQSMITGYFRVPPERRKA